MKLSVVTVVYNDFKHIENTIKSVLEQTYENIEYVIIDGGSNDGTVGVIEKYADNIDYWISEPDKGLYDAMNKAMKIVTGDYLLFLNSGDFFYNDSIVENIFRSANNNTPDIFYGDTVVIDESGNEKGKRRHRPPKELNWKSFKNGMLVSHQAFIPAVKLVEEYDMKYRYSADFDRCIKIMKKSNLIVNTNEIIVKYLDGGLTKKRFFKSLKERFKIMTKNYGLFTTIFIHIRNAFKMIFFAIKHKWI